ncbi:hypothetical protein P9250_00185 [Caballeronia sp. LP006]|uniref:hypothetical protein n=1 Tax=Caballeronia sp. LP006 TaxID=3038552 RepID=UPI002859EF9D|nr:hypothetical protein [Caballeronia sp. LP006]MDR5826272.1 hypothetical protein [Caballeronia sp. LP006]
MKIPYLRIDEPGSSLTPEQIVDALLAGRSITIHQHYFVFDDADEIVWYTNPYGIDGILCKRPSVERFRKLMYELERGRVLGLTPFE